MRTRDLFGNRNVPCTLARGFMLSPFLTTVCGDPNKKFEKLSFPIKKQAFPYRIKSFFVGEKSFSVGEKSFSFVEKTFPFSEKTFTNGKLFSIEGKFNSLANEKRFRVVNLRFPKPVNPKLSKKFNFY